MTDIPIIFSAPMVRALLGGRKTMTRRLAWRLLRRRDGYGPDTRTGSVRPSTWTKVKPGDRLWVRESISWREEDGTLFYRADNATVGRPPANCRITRVHIPGIFMPRWASRITLVVAATKIERLQSIGVEDVYAEGMARLAGDDADPAEAIRHFRNLWDRLHGPGAWDADPEVVAVTFTVRKANIDACNIVNPIAVGAADA